MFRRRFRRKPRVKWFLQPGTAFDNTGGTAFVSPIDNWNGIEFQQFINGASTDRIATSASPLVIDNPIGETTVGTSLATVQKFALNQTNEFGWRLRRIVGDLYIVGDPGNVSQQGLGAPAFMVEAGIIVRRVNENTGNPVENAQSQDVGAIDNNVDPWLWRRNWVITNPIAQTNFLGYAGSNAQGLAAASPLSNWEFGSGLTGGRVDQKTNRIIGPEARLFLNMTIWAMPLGTRDANETVVANGISWWFNYRCLGSVYNNVGNRRNASR